MFSPINLYHNLRICCLFIHVQQGSMGSGRLGRRSVADSPLRISLCLSVKGVTYRCKNNLTTFYSFQVDNISSHILHIWIIEHRMKSMGNDSSLRQALLEGCIHFGGKTSHWSTHRGVRWFAKIKGWFAPPWTYGAEAARLLYVLFLWWKIKARKPEDIL